MFCYVELLLFSTFNILWKVPSSQPLQFLASTSCGGFSHHIQICYDITS